MSSQISPAINLHVLDHPIWSSLTTTHARFASGGDLAKRYPSQVSILSGIKEQSEEAYASLADVSQKDPSEIYLFLDQPAEPPVGWTIELAFPITQMVCKAFLSLDSTNHEDQPIIETLTGEDVPDMLALTALTKPGPFHARTHEMGIYLGIKQNGQLIAMAGERLQPEGYTEISAVCTHPDFRGHGYAKLLVAAVSQQIIDRGQTPFLHVLSDNPAIRVYEQLGFRFRRHIHFASVKAP